MKDFNPRRINSGNSNQQFSGVEQPIIEQDVDLERKRMLTSAAERFSVTPGEIESYIQPNEKLNGFATGGSESLVFFVTRLNENQMRVRKVWSEKFIPVSWEPSGEGVMTPPLQKAKLQIEYLRNLPEDAKPYFPEVYDVREVVRIESAPEGNPIERREVICDLSYIPGVEVSTFVQKYQPSPAVVAHIHREILRCLRDKIHPKRKKERNEQTVEASYLDKMTLD